MPAELNDDEALDPSIKLADGDLAWWRDAKLGLFVHWGVYSVLGRGEWAMFNEHISVAEYRKLGDAFEAKRYDPREWARAARASGMRYVVLTARHHDGFALWDSPGSWDGFDAARHAPRRDLVRPFVEAVREAGLAVGLYYSPMDWRFAGYFEPERFPDDLERMKRQTYDQVAELLSRYGPLNILWYDGAWLAHRGTDADAAWLWKPAQLNRMVRGYQPKVVISPRSGWLGDFKIEEGNQPVTGPIRREPWEKCVSLLESSWGYSDSPLLGRDRVLQIMVDTIVRGGNLLVNVAPDADGAVPLAQLELLQSIGDWVEARADAIYGTRAGPLEPVDECFGMTWSESCAYVFISSWPAAGAPLRLPPIEGKVTAARVLPKGNVRCEQGPAGLKVSVDPVDRDSVATIVELSLAPAGR